MHAVEPPQFFHTLDDDELLAARDGIERELDWFNKYPHLTELTGNWRINLSQTNAEITRRLWS